MDVALVVYGSSKVAFSIWAKLKGSLNQGRRISYVLACFHPVQSQNLLASYRANQIFPLKIAPVEMAFGPPQTSQRTFGVRQPYKPAVSKDNINCYKQNKGIVRRS